MKKRQKLSWYVVAVLILGLVLLAVSCGGTTTAPTEEPSAPPTETEEPKVEEPAVEEPAVEEPATPTGGPTATPHPLEGRDDCLMCHTSGTYAVPADHDRRNNETCTACHKPAE